MQQNNKNGKNGKAVFLIVVIGHSSGELFTGNDDGYSSSSQTHNHY
jgi:hypothetical protein